MGSSTKMDSLLQDINKEGKPTDWKKWGCSQSRWISDEIWRIVDQTNAMDLSPGYYQTEYQCLSRRPKVAFASDQRQRCATTGALAEAELSVGNAREKWVIVRRWYSHASGELPAPSWEDLHFVTDDCINLYTKDAPPDVIPILVAQFDISDEVLNSSEIAEAVKQLKNREASGPSKIRVKKHK